MNITNPYPPHTANTKLFRIPAILTLTSGRIIACSDLRYGNGTDDPANIDSALRYSDDNGKSWSEPLLINSFDDMEFSDYRKAIPKSASFCDSAICEGENNVVYHMCDACPAFMGLWSAGTYGIGSGYIDGHLSLCDITSPDKAESTTLDKEHYPYYVGEFGKDGFAPVLKHSDNSLYNNYYLDSEYYIYKKDGENFTKVTVKQMNKNGTLNHRDIHANVFFAYAPIKIYPTYYLWVKKSLDGGETWSKGKIINNQVDSCGFTGFSPGRGIAVEKGNSTRVLFAIYDNNEKTEYASVIYTDDGGETWHRSKKAREVGEARKSSESQFVIMNNGIIRMYSRNIAGFIGFCDSSDFGESWGEYTLDKDLQYCSNCMISVINYSKELDGKKALIISYPSLRIRKGGIIKIGLYGNDNKVRWKYCKKVTDSLKPFSFVYSCLTETAEGDILNLYESDKAEFTLKGYSVEELTVNESTTLSAAQRVKSAICNKILK